MLIDCTVAYTANPSLSGTMKKFKFSTIEGASKSWRKAFTWKNGDGDILDLENFKDKIVLINYWATWCLPCIQELPSLDSLQQSLGGKSFTVIAINLDRGGKRAANRTIKRLNLKHLSLYLDQDSKSVKILGVRYMPTTFLFDRKGRQIGKLEGKAEWNDKDSLDLINFFIQNPNHIANEFNSDYSNGKRN